MDLVQEVAQAFAVPRLDVGYAGRKDKLGITEQWLSVRTEADMWPDIEDTQCLSVTRHSKKLRIGELAGNNFKIVVRDTTVDLDTFNGLRSGFPNAFGPQRVSATNVEQATDWLLTQRERIVDRRRGRGKAKRRKGAAEGWHLSVLRSYLFNQILTARIAQQTGNTVGISILDGDVLERGVPTAPLWGRGRSRSSSQAAQIETDALEPFAEICAALEYAGVSQGRRAMWVKPEQFQATEIAEGQIELSFFLPPGAYATAMLASVRAAE